MEFVILFFVLFVALFLVVSSLVVINEYERGVIFRFGKVVGFLKPGLQFRIPFGIDVIKKVDLRTRTINVPQQEIITKDNISILIDAVVYYNVKDPILALTKVVDFQSSTALLGQTTLRSTMGQHELDEILENKENLYNVLKTKLSETMDDWGIAIASVEIKSIEIPDTMKRAMAKQAEAEREKRAKITTADGEFQASQKLLDAATIIAQEPAALQLRYLQTLTEIAVEKNSTILFPLPIELLKGFGMMDKDKK